MAPADLVTRAFDREMCVLKPEPKDCLCAFKHNKITSTQSEDAAEDAFTDSLSD